MLIYEIVRRITYTDFFNFNLNCTFPKRIGFIDVILKPTDVQKFKLDPEAPTEVSIFINHYDDA